MDQSFPYNPNPGKLARRQEQLSSGIVYNIDGEALSFNPCQGRCTRHYLQSIRPIEGPVTQRYRTLGGVVTAPVFYIPC